MAFPKSPFNLTVASAAQSIGFHAFYYFEIEILEIDGRLELVDLIFDDFVESFHRAVLFLAIFALALHLRQII